MAWFTAKEWKNRLVEFAGRRSLKNVTTNETTVYDVTRNEGQVSQEGDAFSATNMNDLEQRISDGFTSAEEANNQLSSETDRIRVYVGSDGKLHFVNKAGADSELPFSDYQMLGTLSPVSYSQNGTIQQRTWQYDIASKYGGYNNITIDNIIAQIMTACGGAVSGPNDISYAYNSSNGRLSLTAAMQTFNDNASYPTLKVAILR